MLEEEGPRQEHVEKGVKLPLSDGRRNFPLLAGGLGGTWWQQLLLSEKGVSGSPPPPPSPASSIPRVRADGNSELLDIPAQGLSRASKT